MKIVKCLVLFSVLLLMVACGGGAKPEAAVEDEGVLVRDTVPTDSLRLKANKYENSGLGYSIIYPEEVFVLQENTKNSDCQVFLPGEGDAKFVIFKDERQSKDGKTITFNEAFDLDRTSKGKRQISYNALNPLFYSISGVDGNVIFYQKTIISKGKMVTAKLTYKKEDKPTYDAMIAPLFNSFK